MPRPRQFDEPALLDAAIELFWSHGYADTSIADVALASTVGNGSIYAAYRSKDGLYLQAVVRYCRRLTETVREAMQGSSGDVATSLRAYLELIICDCVSQPGRRGCLMLNSLTLVDRVPELRPVIDATTRELQEIVAARLRRDLAGGADQVDVEGLSAHYVTLSQGLIHRSRLGHGPDELRAVADATLRFSPGRSA
ncbi:TetR/AcrR family transcriptional regulator [Nocardioides lianchengensis]|uniref:DNA-binding transcriptional regulator, AcrR family n=1 Tax=Nocardioides lianchengensis TaxID=1045774 RepID=A0A1G7A799_9ACTN|nr:TetR/AcrR family transcriptional regulator [Nocardioides lianchengensis]NYG13687.1 TetR/AcrR family transcriptional repressor of nem operon [Nocardioides lianchengensis]SDE10699.1 DNA-binding transcriptional regulator, AcrR family [Nocardioides lianchengensis]